MKLHLLVLPVFLTTTAAMAMGDTLSAPADAQAQAAALLSPPHTSGTSKADGQKRSSLHVSPVMDAQSSAAALLSRPRTTGTATASVSAHPTSAARMAIDAQKQAAALLTGSRTSTQSRLRAQRTQNAVEHGG
jgi:hypothetical protein